MPTFEKIGVVYIIENTTLNQIYVGKANDENTRLILAHKQSPLMLHPDTVITLRPVMAPAGLTKEQIVHAQLFLEQNMIDLAKNDPARVLLNSKNELTDITKRSTVKATIDPFLDGGVQVVATQQGRKVVLTPKPMDLPSVGKPAMLLNGPLIYLNIRQIFHEMKIIDRADANNVTIPEQFHNDAQIEMRNLEQQEVTPVFGLPMVNPYFRPDYGPS